MHSTGMTTQSSPLLKMTFETTMSFMMDAALSADVDQLGTPAASIVVGRCAVPARLTLDYGVCSR